MGSHIAIEDVNKGEENEIKEFDTYASDQEQG